MHPQGGYSQAISVSGEHKTIYICGQNAIDEKGNIVGKNSLKRTNNAGFSNIEKILKETSAALESIVKFNIYFVQGQKPLESFQLSRKMERKKVLSITVLFVAGLGKPRLAG